MKKLTTIAALLFAVLLTSFTPAGWVKVQSTAGKFNLTFPQKPQEQSQELDSEIGKLKMSIYSYESTDPNDSNSTYGLIYTDYPETKISSDLSEAVVDQFFDDAIRGMVADRKGSITSLLKSSYKDVFPAKFVKISFAENHTVLNILLILAHNRFYILQVGCDTKNDDNTLIKKFFRSFEYTGPLPVKEDRR